MIRTTLLAWFRHRRHPRHSHKAGAYLSPHAIGSRIADDRAAAEKHAAWPASIARQAEIAAAMDAPTEINLPAVIDAEIVTDTWRDPAVAIGINPAVTAGVIDATTTLPITRRELMGMFEVDGGRPMHELDHIQRYCSHATSMYGRCAECGMTWADQADAMGVAR